MNTKYSNFSEMKWLDEEIERNEKSPGRNKRSDFYYKTLLEIRTAQRNGTITDELYSKLNSRFVIVPPEEGYYLANIHYECFSDYETLEIIENRMIEYLATSDLDVLKNNQPFRNLFLNDLRVLMISRKNINEYLDDEAFFKKFGSDIEQTIISKYSEILNF